ncbi:TetR family transcriptional regulator [Paenibacillus pinihumi]|uniref:TetR family transcriptional regulator n=1 Tax=Paenibacillus pinihumi TaxID=669462 RepID=UPI0004098A1C|nr:TetR family transcriptional regulator [Paenibacillus pinihumi]
MAEETLTKDLILDAAEAVLRKYGPSKANVSDIARAIGVSHAALYRHYDNKAALRKAVVDRWLHGVFEPLGAVLAEKKAPDQLLYRWLRSLWDFKRERARKDPELFAMYALLVAETEGAVEFHVESLLLQLASIIESGMSSGVFGCKDARQSAFAVFMATSRFHHTAHAPEWETPDAESRFEAVFQLVLNGLLSKS